MKKIQRINFLEIFEKINGVEEILKQDPANVYEKMDYKTKEYYRGKIKEISKKTLGIPVIAIGIPTVVDLATVTNECIDIFIENLQEKAMSNDYLNKLKERDNYEDIKEALVPKDYNMIVTPKEVDDLIENMKNIVAKSINYAI